MFGLLRTLLAFFVVIGHLFGPGLLGNYAVFGFYILSGYLMTTIMHRTYGFTIEGRKNYVINRFLRIYPAYWFSLSLSIVILLLFGKEITAYHSAIYLPNSLGAGLRNILLFLSFEDLPRLSPSTWALTIEIFFYLAIGVGVSKNKFITIIWFVASIVYTLFSLFAMPDDWTARYFTIRAASLPFSLGAMMYHYKNGIQSFFQKYSLNQPILWFVLVCLNCCGSFFLEAKYKIPITLTVGLYINLMLMAILIQSLMKASFPFVSKKTDGLLGKLSYPIYLTHWQVAAVLHVTVFPSYWRGMTLQGAAFLLFSLCLVILLSLLMSSIIDPPIEKLRKRVKNNNSLASKINDL